MAAEAATTFGRVLRRQRIAAGLTQEELAERAGVSTRGIQDLERGVRRTPHPETMRRLAAALGRPTEPTPPSLPLVPNSFIGREGELQAVTQALRHSRLVTLTGAGGIGKTRLALEVGRASAQQFADGVSFVELAPVSEGGGQVVQAVARALDVREQPLRSLQDTLCTVMQHQEALLVVDNCEHVVADAAALIQRLLAACAEVRILATSREGLRVTGEHVWLVPPLEVPEARQALLPDALERHGATRLFLERARAAGRDVPCSARSAEAIVTICSKLDGVPLGIELAAARTSMFGVGEIAERLDDALRLLSRGSRSAPLRHQTLRGAIEWSFDLLSPAEQQLLEHLSVFAGGFTFEAVEAIVGAPNVLGLLSQLVDKSLVIAHARSDGARRYRLQEVLRQFGHERLEARGKTAVADARAPHAAFYLEMVEHVVPHAFRADRKVSLDRLELELDNLRAAKRFFVEQRDAESAQRLCTRLFRMLCYRGHCGEGCESLREALALPGGPASVRGRALQMLGALAYLQADYRTAKRVGDEAVALHRAMGDPEGLAWSLGSLGSAAIVQGEFDRAEALLADAVEHGRRGQGAYIVALDLSLWAMAAYHCCAFATARERAEAALELASAAAYASPGCSSLITLGGCLMAQGEHVAAEEALRRSLEWAQKVDEPYLVARTTVPLARLAIQAHRIADAAELIVVSITAAEGVSNAHLMAQALEVVAQLTDDRALGAKFVASARSVRDAIGAPLSPAEARLLGDQWPMADAWPLEEAAARAIELTRDLY